MVAVYERGFLTTEDAREAYRKYRTYLNRTVDGLKRLDLPYLVQVDTSLLMRNAQYLDRYGNPRGTPVTISTLTLNHRIQMGYYRFLYYVVTVPEGL